MDAARDSSRAITLSLPATSEFASTLRVIAASLGADLGFTLDEIDDLRLALNEVFTSIADGDGERVSVAFHPAADRVTVEVTAEPPRAIELDELAMTILASVVDAFRLDDQRAVFSKQARESSS